MTKSYQIVPPPGSPPTLDPQQLAELLAQDGQLILPLLDLLENAQCALDDLIDVIGRATIEAVLRMSAAAIAGPKQQGKKSDATSSTTGGRSRGAEGAAAPRRDAPVTPPQPQGGRTDRGRDPRLRPPA